MKKAIRFLTIIGLLLAFALTLASCENLGGISDSIGGMVDISLGTHSHSFGRWETTLKPTCTEDGEKMRFCDCGEKQSSIIVAEGHNYGKDNVCTVCGHSRVSVCTHQNIVTVPEVPASCTQAGVSKYTMCGDCGTVIQKPITLPISHKYDSGVCGFCGKPCPHENRVTVKGYAGTCYKEGLTDGEKCGDCGKIFLEQTVTPFVHSYDSNEICSLCGKGSPNENYPWNETSLLIQLYENDNNGELSSGLKRYCAGQDTAGTEEIDTLVRNRNANADKYVNVKVKYNYETSYSWGGSTQHILVLATSATRGAPDIFANFAYDMTACALRGCFANLLANTDKTSTKYGDGQNYFAFTKSDYDETIDSDDYFESNAGEGYLFEYMQSLTFANKNGVHDKMYLLASNYTLDAIRASLVVPVNINMLNEIGVNSTTDIETGKNLDINNDGTFNVEDLYELVWNYGWTYDQLALLSGAVYADSNKTIAGADINDKLGFCLGSSSGLSASGILYSSSIRIIEKVIEFDGTVTYKYPEKNDSLVEFADALKDLFTNSIGVCALSYEDARTASIGNVKSDLDGIRNRFAINQVLFGGIIALGSLENSVYQGMKTGNGFGVVPVPLYTQDSRHSYEYNTVIHNLARIFAISKTTTKFEQCSAYLDYQSTNSKDIVEMYYEKNFVAAVDAGKAAKPNVEMLKYIRNHARDCFDKTYDDIIFAYQNGNDAQSSTKRWHGIFYSNGYVVSSMEMRYRDESPEKQVQLEIILTQWSHLN